MNIWDDFRHNFPDIGFDDNLRGYQLMKAVESWAALWPEMVRIQKVGDALATSSMLVFIKHGGGIEMVVIPQNANKPTLIHISRPNETLQILGDLS